MPALIVGAPGGARSLHLNGRNSSGMRARAHRHNLGTDKPEAPSADSARSSTYQSLDQIVEDLGLPLGLQRRLRKGLVEAEQADDVLRAVVAGPLRMLRVETGDPALVREVGVRFKAYLDSGLVKATQPRQPKPKAAPQGKPMPSKPSVGKPVAGGGTPPQGSGTRGLPVGTIRKWRHGTFRKEAGGQWVPVSDGGTRATKPEDPKKKVAPQPGQTQGKRKERIQAADRSKMQEVDTQQRTAELHDYLGGHDADTFNALPKHERAELAANMDETRGALGAYDPTEPYSTEDMQSVVRSAAKHVRQLTQDGVFGAQSAVRMMELVHLQQDLASEVGLDSQTFAELLEGNVRKLAHQEEASTERTLGDHGVRHVSVNVKNTMSVLDALKGGGKKVGPRERMIAVQVMIEHDMGYAIPAIHEGGFKIRDNFHPQASRKLWEQQPELAEVFGQEDWADMARMIETHSTSEVDWENDMLGSAIRLADNTHLFADKFPEVLFDSRKGVELVAKVAILQKATGADKGAFKVGVRKLQDALIAHIDGRGDLSLSERARLTRAAREIGPSAPKFLARRLAGRNATYDFDGKASGGAGKMGVTIEHSDARAAVGAVFGPDQADLQFEKLLKDYGFTADELAKLESPPPSLEVGVPPGAEGKEVINFRWEPGKKTDTRELAFASALEETSAEWGRIQKMVAGGQKRKAAEDKFFGSLTKAFWALS